MRLWQVAVEVAVQSPWTWMGRVQRQLPDSSRQLELISMHRESDSYAYACDVEVCA